MNKSGYIYLIRSGDGPLYKIGRTKDPESRLSNLQAGNPAPLTLVNCACVDDAAKIEAAYHRSLKEYAVFGEWFALPETTAQAIENLMNSEFFEYIEPPV